jgi:asparagine synthetase A
VGLAALRALSQITHPAVRQLTFRLVDTQAKWRRQAVELLARNFSPGDHVIALRWFETEKDLETLHSLGMDLKDLWERHPDEETEVPMLLALYERGPCSFCRERPVRRLIER